MKIKKYLILLILVSLAALVLHLWKLGSIPPSLNWDEAAWGYNAYSILNTGRDEYGKLLPFILKSFGDFKPAFYVYLAVISVKIFGLNEFAVRFPAAVFGSLLIFPLFLIVKELFADFKGKLLVAILASFILAFSPWHYHYSHGAWEGNILLFFALLGIWFFLKALRQNNWLFYFSAFSFGVCFYIYQSAKMFIPLIIFGLLILFFREINKSNNKMILIKSLVLLTIMALPIFSYTFLGNAGGRLKIMSVFSYPMSVQEKEQIIQEEGKTAPDFTFAVFHGPPHYFLRAVLGRWLNHFSPRFLFFEGDWTNPRNGVPNAGQLNHLSILLLPLGVFFLISRKIKNQSLIWYLLLIAPLPAALSRDTIQATRSYFMIIPLTIISAFGVYFIWEKLGKANKFIKAGFLVILTLGYFLSFIYYLDQFFVHAPIQNSSFWQYGYKQVVQFIDGKEQDYQKIIFTQKHGQPYIYYLFYTQYPPQKYQSQAKLIENTQGDVGRVERIDNFEFREIYWPADRQLKNTLFIGGPYELPEQDIDPKEAKLLKKINFLNGETAFNIVETIR